MNRNITSQKGVTLIGLILILGVIAAFVLFGLRLFPLYNEKFGVMGVMKIVATQPGAATMTHTELYKIFYNNADIQGLRDYGIEQVMKERVKFEKGEKGGPPVIHVTFEKRSKLFDDIELVLNFDKTMPLGGAGGGDE